MLRISAAVLLGIVLLGAPLPPQISAQHDEAAQQRNAAEFTQLWERVGQTSDPAERGAFAERALELEPKLGTWPLKRARDEVRALLWWASGLGHLSRVDGGNVESQERAIAAYSRALEYYTRDRSATGWASLQNDRGSVYGSRLRGDRADNMEKAIADQEAALTVRTRKTMPREWAQTQYSLAFAYQNRIRGDRADNMEKAIAAHEAALAIWTREAMPREWAQTQNSLAFAYQNRIRGDRADNLEKAIAACEAALTVATPEAMPRERARAQNNLGNAYRNRIRGDHADNLERAIAAHEATLAIWTREAMPREWAQAQTDLGTAYWARLRGDRADNVEKAIAAFEAALTVATRQAMPNAWATAQANLGAAYWFRIRGDRADNLERAIAGYEAALTVFKREAEASQWAQTQIALAAAYWARIHGDPADNKEKAIAASAVTLTVATREAMPREWALAQNNVCEAYRDRILGDRADNLEKAIAACEAALAIRTREALPRDHLATSRLLGEALLAARQWDRAAAAFAGARETFRQLFGQGLNEAEARGLISVAGPLFAEAAFVATERGELPEAMALANEGRALQLRVALRQQALELPADKRPRHDALVAELRGWERIAESAKGADAIKALDDVVRLRGQLAELTAPYLPREVALTRDQIPDGGAVVMSVITKFGSKLLVATAGGDAPAVAAVDLPGLDSKRLDTLMRGEDGKSGWLGAYSAQLDDFPRWRAAIEGLEPELWQVFGAAFDRALQERGVKPGARIVLMPTAALGLLPLGLAQEPGSGRRLAETYELVRAPSFEALAAAARQAGKPVAPSLAAAINPTGEIEELALPFTEIEGALIAARFAGRPQLRLDKFTATPGLVVEALKGRSYWHFASHGTFDKGNARQSGLMMRDRETLTIGRLLDNQASLGRPRLVVLSACETGLYDIAANPDEFVGLPATFMQVGAAGVVGSLWLVDDLATALLMARLYELHIGAGIAPPTALRQAQAWLRQATRAELLAYVEAAAARTRLDADRLDEFKGALTRGSRSAASRFTMSWTALHERAEPGGATEAKTKPATAGHPFEHPYYWAGFVYTGL